MSASDVRRSRDDVSTSTPDGASHEDKPESPTELRKQSWGYVLRKTLHEFTEDQCTDLAAALTYYAVLAVFPAAIALISTIGVFADPAAAVDNVLKILRPLVSSQILGTIEPFLTSVAQSDAAGVGLVVGLLAALWSASGYVGAFSRAMNKIYEIEEGRPFWKLRPVMLLLTFVSVLLAATVLVLLVVSGPILQSIGNVVGLGDAAVTTFAIVKWPLVLVMVVVLVGLLYYVTPNIQQPKFKWISVGAAAAIGIWVVASVAFGLYLATFANYSKTYGAAASVIVALLFVWITNLALLFGAELDSELERGRQLQAGLPAEEDLQLPPRDTRNIKKLRKQRDKDAAIGRKIRREAGQRDDASAATDAPHREQKEGTP
ncbi:ribonuclease BN [Marmoricola sp. Leaf446]|uniref:YihY/virulence factor BrkB family protein n=1 Tax=Marmoricola sp. Leaf446 TaxID=1736379 RepID=UPI0006F87159|nr:YihY/virulence factor BrkB family protein [Marmoricola sp. Leaf446]KQT94296.1 ribonuclease BN [Marmoricola sp. Leaf446]